MQSAEETLDDIDNELLSVNELEFNMLPFLMVEDKSLEKSKQGLFDNEQLKRITNLTNTVISQPSGENKVSTVGRYIVTLKG